MDGGRYGGARAAAPRVAEHFAKHIAAARRDAAGTAVAFCPDVPTLEAIIDAAFWASLRREEGRTPKISLAYLSPDAVSQPMRFTDHLPLRPAALVRVAPAVN